MVKVVKGTPARWGACSRTILLGRYTDTLSYHNNSIAVGSEHGEIIILNAITGSQSTVLSGHTSLVTCVAFSSEGTSLVSGSSDNTVKLWDVQTGGVVETFLGHTDPVWSVSISADLTTIASGSYYQIYLWNIQTGECCQTIYGQGYEQDIKFSPTDPHHFISISGNKVWQWDANGSQTSPPFSGSNVTFSSDGAQFISCFKKTITVQYSDSGAIITEFQAVDNAHRCCLSPDNRLIAVATANIAYCWDVTTSEPQLVETFIGHAEPITSLTFSSSTTLVSASKDNSVKFWQIEAQSANQLATGLKLTSPSAPIDSIILKSKQDTTFIVHSDGVVKTWDTSTGIYRISSQIQANCYIKDAQLVDGRLILVWCYYFGGIHVWDGENEEFLWKTRTPPVDDIKISGDGSRVFVLCENSVLAWSLQTGEVMGEVKSKWSDCQSLIVDESKVWVFIHPSKYKGWDFGILGSKPVKLSNRSTPPSVRSLQDTNETRIKSPATGETVFQLSWRFWDPVCIKYNDSSLVAGYKSGEILILDLRSVK